MSWGWPTHTEDEIARIKACYTEVDQPLGAWPALRHPLRLPDARRRGRGAGEGRCPVSPRTIGRLSWWLSRSWMLAFYGGGNGWVVFVGPLTLHWMPRRGAR